MDVIGWVQVPVSFYVNFVAGAVVVDFELNYYLVVNVCEIFLEIQIATVVGDDIGV